MCSVHHSNRPLRIRSVGCIAAWSSLASREISGVARLGGGWRLKAREYPQLESVNIIGTLINPI